MSAALALPNECSTHMPALHRLPCGQAHEALFCIIQWQLEIFERLIFPKALLWAMGWVWVMGDNVGTLAVMGTRVVAARPMWPWPWDLRNSVAGAEGPPL